MSSGFRENKGLLGGGGWGSGGMSQSRDRAKPPLARSMLFCICPFGEAAEVNWLDTLKLSVNIINW